MADSADKKAVATAATPTSVTPIVAPTATATASATAAVPAVASATPALARPASVAAASKEEQLLVCMRVDYPPKQIVCRVSSLLTVGGLRTECGKQLGITTALAAHDFRAVNTGSDVLSLGVRGDHQLITEAGVQNRSTIFLTAPATLKPQKSKPKKKTKRAAKDEKDDSGGGSKDRYKGLSVKTILKKLTESGLKEKEEKVALEFFDIYCEKILLQPDFMGLEEKLVAKLLKRDQLNAPEISIYEAVLRWGTKHAPADMKDQTAARAQAIKDLLPLIRFPTMEMSDLASKVAPSNLLTPEQMLALYTFMGSSSKDGSKLPWTSRARIGRRPPAWFSWDPAKKANQIQLSNDNMTATSPGGGAWGSVFGNKEMTGTDTYEWEVSIEQYDTSNSYNLTIGVCPATFTNWTYTSIVGYQPQAPGWAYITGNGQKCNNSTAVTAFIQPANAGTVVRCRVNLKKNTMEVALNKDKYSVMYTNVYGPVRPVISMTQAQRITLRFPRSSE